MNIVEKCIAWNKARYDQVLDIDLAVKLLTEETEELYDANTDLVQALDAIGDITFVAIGVLWKAGMSMEDITVMLDADNKGLVNISTPTLYIGYPIALAIVSETCMEKEWGHFSAMSAACLAIFGIVLPRLINMGMEAAFYDIVEAICDSNNTKVVKGKTDPSVKANIDKGESFIPPTMALQRILARYTTDFISKVN